MTFELKILSQRPDAISTRSTEEDEGHPFGHSSRSSCHHCHGQPTHFPWSSRSSHILDQGQQDEVTFRAKSFSSNQGPGRSQHYPGLALSAPLLGQWHAAATEMKMASFYNYQEVFLHWRRWGWFPRCRIQFFRNSCHLRNRITASWCMAMKICPSISTQEHT